MFSVGILYSSVEFLVLVQRQGAMEPDFTKSFSTFHVASAEVILETSQKCQWTKLTAEGSIVLSSRGLDILNCDEPSQRLRIQIGHLIESQRPRWLPLLSKGRAEAEKYLATDVRQCFQEAGLFGDLSDEIVAWWDMHSQLSRRVARDTNLDLGRRGEKLSIDYERQRTGREPFWQGFESNLAGYDVRSFVSSDGLQSLSIEVKTSNSPLQTAEFFVTRNEWEVATNTEHYVFHLWNLKPTSHLTIVEAEGIGQHIPSDQGQGEWQKVKIPFAAFVQE